MKITIMTDGHTPSPKTYDRDSIVVVPNLGDTVIINGTPLEVYERVFDFEKNPGEAIVRCKSRQMF